MKLELEDNLKTWSKYAKTYDPIKCASIDGTDCEPHDRAVVRALNSTYKPNRFVKGRPECTIFVSRLNHETSKDTIKDIFSKYGKLKRFRMVKDIVTGMPKGYAFVEYEEEQAAEEAYRLTNKMVIDGNIIFVDFECERLLKGWKPRRLGGGFAGKKESGQLRFGGRDRPFKKPIALELKEQEDKKQREKERRIREDDRHRRDKSRDRYKKKSPHGESGISSPRSRKKQESPSRGRVKRPVSPNHKTGNQSPPRKTPRYHSPPKEKGHSSRFLHREKNIEQKDASKNIKVNSPSREKIRPTSPSQKTDIRTAPRETGKQCSSQEKVVIPKSPARESTKQKSPVRVNVKQKSSEVNNRQRSPTRDQAKHKSLPKDNSRQKSPMRKNTKYPPKVDPPIGKSERRRSPLGRHHSPPRQNSRPPSPSERYCKRSPPRDRNRRRSPLERRMKYSPERDADRRRVTLPRNDKRPFTAREKSRSRSPLQGNTKYNSSREDDRRNQNLRRESPQRKQGSYPSERDNDRRRSPVHIPEQPHLSPQLNIKHPSVSKAYSPARGREYRTHQFQARDHYSPGRRSPRDVSRQYSPARQQISRQLSSDDDTRGYHENVRGTTHHQARDYRGISPILHRGVHSPPPEHFQREQRVNSSRHENERHPPAYDEYDQFPTGRGNREHFSYDEDNQYDNFPPYSANSTRSRNFPPGHSDFRQYSPQRIDFHQPPPSYDPSREYPTFQSQSDMASFPPPSRDFPPSRDVESDRQRPRYFSPQHQNERQHYPSAREEGNHYESYEEFPTNQKPPYSFPPIPGGRKFPPHENTGHTNAGRIKTNHFPPRRGGSRGSRGGFRQY